MKLIVLVLVALAISVGLGIMAMDDPGYVVLSRDPYVVRLPLLLFVLIIAVVFLLMYLLFNFIAGVVRTPKKIGQWREKSNENAAQKYTMQGYAGLIEGNWSAAEASLVKKLEHNQAPLMNYLGAAYAAQQQGNHQRRNQYLDEGLARNPNQYLAITLTRARLHWQAGEANEARECLESLRKSSPKNAPAAKLLADVYSELGEWEEVVKLIPVMRKLDLYPAEEISRREDQARENLLESTPLLENGGDSSGAAWKNLSWTDRKNPVVVSAVVKQLVNAGKLSEAEFVLRRSATRSPRRSGRRRCRSRTAPSATPRSGWPGPGSGCSRRCATTPPTRRSPG